MVLLHVDFDERQTQLLLANLMNREILHIVCLKTNSFDLEIDILSPMEGKSMHLDDEVNIVCGLEQRELKVKEHVLHIGWSLKSAVQLSEDSGVLNSLSG